MGKMVSVREASKVLGIAPSTVYGILKESPGLGVNNGQRNTRVDLNGLKVEVSKQEAERNKKLENLGCSGMLDFSDILVLETPYGSVRYFKSINQYLLSDFSTKKMLPSSTKMIQAQGGKLERYFSDSMKHLISGFFTITLESLKAVMIYRGSAQLMKRAKNESLLPKMISYLESFERGLHSPVEDCVEPDSPGTLDNYFGKGKTVESPIIEMENPKELPKLFDNEGNSISIPTNETIRVTLKGDKKEKHTFKKSPEPKIDTVESVMSSSTPTEDLVNSVGLIKYLPEDLRGQISQIIQIKKLEVQNELEILNRLIQMLGKEV